MRVLILANNDVGLYKFRKELIKALIDKGCEVYISLPYGEMVEPLTEMGCIFVDTDIDRRGINPVSDMKILKAYIGMLNNIQPDLVITYTIKPNIYGGIACRLKKVPYYCNITGLGTAFQKENWLKKIVTMLYKLALKKVKTVFFENAENEKIFIENKIIDKKRTCLLNGAGVNLAEYTFSEYPDEKTVHFLFIGRVMKEKGIDELFYAARRMHDEGIDAEIDIVGPMEDNYKSEVEKLNESGIINYFGYQSDVKPFIEKAHCFVLPSYHEGMANTLLESAAMARPLITSNIHGCMEAVRENESGFLCDIGNPEALTECMLRFCSLTAEEKALMGKKSREHIENNFDKNKVVKRTMEALNIG